MAVGYFTGITAIFIAFACPMACPLCCVVLNEAMSLAF